MIINLEINDHELITVVRALRICPNAFVERFIASLVRDDRQRIIQSWAVKTFGEIANDSAERGRRLLEEALELAQAVGVRREDALALVERVFSNIPGEISREIGQCGLVLLSLAEQQGFSAEAEEAREIARVLSLLPDYFRSRHDAKAEIGIALPRDAQPVQITDDLKQPRSEGMPFVYGIVDSEGSPHWDEGCVASQADMLEIEVHSLNDAAEGQDPHRVVELRWFELTEAVPSYLPVQVADDLRQPVETDPDNDLMDAMRWPGFRDRSGMDQP